MAIFFELVPPEAFPTYASMVSAVYAVSLLLRPTLGGLINDSGVWRWDFLLNVPGGVPTSPAALARSQRQFLSYAANGVQIRIPTAQIFGRNDIEYPEFGPVLRDLCEPDESTVFVHDGGHEVPDVGDKKGLLGAVRYAVARAEERQ